MLPQGFEQVKCTMSSQLPSPPRHNLRPHVSPLLVHFLRFSPSGRGIASKGWLSRNLIEPCGRTHFLAHRPHGPLPSTYRHYLRPPPRGFNDLGWRGISHQPLVNNGNLAEDKVRNDTYRDRTNQRKKSAFGGAPSGYHGNRKER